MTILTLLLRLEWSGSETTYLCPICAQSRMAGHAKSCELAAWIATLNNDRTDTAAGTALR